MLQRICLQQNAHQPHNLLTSNMYGIAAQWSANTAASCRPWCGTSVAQENPTLSRWHTAHNACCGLQHNMTTTVWHFAQHASLSVTKSPWLRHNTCCDVTCAAAAVGPWPMAKCSTCAQSQTCCQNAFRCVSASMVHIGVTSPLHHADNAAAPTTAQ
jgi:hypothetical protein